MQRTADPTSHTPTSSLPRVSVGGWFVLNSFVSRPTSNTLSYPCMDDPLCTTAYAGKCQKHGLRKRDRGQIYSSHLVPRHNSYQGSPPSSGHDQRGALIISEQLFPAVTELAKRGLLSRNMAMQPTTRQP